MLRRFDGQSWAASIISKLLQIGFGDGSSAFDKSNECDLTMRSNYEKFILDGQRSLAAHREVIGEPKASTKAMRSPLCMQICQM